MPKRSWAERRHNRYTKGMRRIKEDRAQHGRDHSCPCFGSDGATFSRFADTPTPCSNPNCCGNPRHSSYWNDSLTVQEKKAPTIHDWE